ncbi:MAG: agmatinase [Deltaproteobacteria bacterium]|nr:agmatinase [Deltaproteobacteria bacterium]
MTHVSPSGYFDVPPEFSRYDSSRFVILPVPYEASTSYGHGAARGPAAILSASRQVELYDEVSDSEPFRAGIHSLPPVAVDGAVGAAAMERIAAAVRPHLRAGKFPIVLGGEHSLTTGVVRAVRDHAPEVGVVQCDAHGDLRDTYQDSPWSHACVMRRLAEMGCPTVGVGIRSCCPEERDFMRHARLPRWFAHEIVGHEQWIDEVIAATPPRVFVTFDVDVFDPGIMSATGTPEPGGLGWYPVLAFLKRLFAAREVVGMDVVELAPQPHNHAADFLVAKLIYKTIGFQARTQ